MDKTEIDIREWNGVAFKFPVCEGGKGKDKEISILGGGKALKVKLTDKQLNDFVCALMFASPEEQESTAGL